MLEADSIRQLVAYSLLSIPITSHMWKGVYYLSFDPTVGRIVVIVDVYYEFWMWLEKTRSRPGKESAERRMHPLKLNIV